MILRLEQPDGSVWTWKDTLTLDVYAGKLYPGNSHAQHSSKQLQPGSNLTMAAPGVLVFGSAEHFAACQKELYGADE